MLIAPPKLSDSTHLLLGFYFLQTFCMTPTASNVVFFATRGVAAAGSGLMGIYASNVFQARVRSLATGLCAAAYRLGILTAPYVGQILLQNRSVLLAILTFALVAICSAVGSIVLPRMRVLHTVRDLNYLCLLFQELKAAYLTKVFQHFSEAVIGH